MRAIKIFVITTLVLSFITIGVSGNSVGNKLKDDSKTIEYSDMNISVLFDSTIIENDVSEKIADRLVYGQSEYDAVPMLSFCWLFGHDIENHSVAVIEHRVRSTNPRCLKKVYKVDTCTKCDYMVEEMVSSAYIICCPND